MVITALTNIVTNSPFCYRS